MFEKIKAWFTSIGVKMGLIKEIKSLQEHKNINLDEKAFGRIGLNKKIYQGYVKEWHRVSYKSSNGEDLQRDMKTLGVGKITASKFSRLIFNEKCDIDVSTRGIEADEEVEDKAKEFIINALNDNFFTRDFPRYLEYCFALGGIAIKPYVDGKQIKLAWATADSFIPLSEDANNVDEALFITKEKKGDKYYTLLEWHEWEDDLYVITNELYESNSEDKIGYKVSLDLIYEGLEPRTELRGLTRPLFVYLKPNTANNKDLNSPLGISIYENAYDTIFLLDYLIDFFFHEFKLGKRRIAVNRGTLKPIIHDDGRVEKVFDSSETVFEAIGIDDNSNAIKDLSVGLRVDEIVKGINHLLDVLSVQMGLSTGTFTFTSQGVITATQVISENSETYQTKNNHETLVELAIKNLIISMLELAIASKFYSGTSDVDVTVNFDDSIADDRTENYKYYSRAVIDGLYPKKRAIMKIFKVTEKEAEAIMLEISAEKQEAIEDEIDFRMDMVGVDIPAPVNQETETMTTEQQIKEDEAKEKQRLQR